MANTYKIFKEIVKYANSSPDTMTMVDVSVDMINLINIMIEELKEGIEHTQRIKSAPFSSQDGINSYLITKAKDYADFMAEQYWSE